MTDISGFLTICLKNMGQQSPDTHKPCEQKFSHTEIKQTVLQHTVTVLVNVWLQEEVMQRHAFVRKTIHAFDMKKKVRNRKKNALLMYGFAHL